ncbi:transducin family protein / WD-40 repeat family protein [Quillaja saponaria]|uniref:Transducin family protein / WD-40 repeat family protein n=1 Tax=Quillaja saponaria TaxID=32244 RepID=A0AAD7PR20_QUISA|nr:transducin family protein / WD-40 repeat family protein [Quillaja saponaria]
MDPQVVLHYGIPSAASILAFDQIQHLLAVGTLDGKIKVIGGDNIEGLLISPKPLPFKNLEFLQNQGFLASVSNDNEVQVWDLENRQIASTLQWESTITAFSVIYGTSYIYIGSEYGMVYILKFDSEDRKLQILPYYVPTNVIAEAVGMSSLDHVSVVRVLHQPCSEGNRLLIAYENGLLVLWDASEDRVVLVRGHTDLELKDNKMAGFSKEAKDELSDDTLEHKELEKEISSVCWASNDGSVVAVGYVDGDIMFWDISADAAAKNKQPKNLSTHAVKLQLSSGNRRLPVIVLHWSGNRSSNDYGGQLFIYGGDEIGSEEVLTILSLDWSSGIDSLKCVGRVDLTLNGSFADMVLLSSNSQTGSTNTMLFILTNPGQLHLYDSACLSTLMSQQENKTSVSGIQNPLIIPTLEPYMTTAKLFLVYEEGKSSRALSEIIIAAKNHAAQNQINMDIEWPLTGGVPSQLCNMKDYHVNQLYIAGYQDGSVWVWDATDHTLSLVYVLESEVKGVKIAGINGSISALDFCSDSSRLAIGNEYGLVRLYEMIKSSGETSLHIVTETKSEVHKLHQGDGPCCTAVFSLLNSAICTLKFASLGVRLAVGYECGRVAVFDIGTLSVLFLTDSVSDSSSPVISLDVKCLDICSSINFAEDSESEILNNPGKGVVFIMTKDAHIVAIDCASGNIVFNRSLDPKKELTALSMYIIDGDSFTELSSEKISLNSPQNNEAISETPEATTQSVSAVIEVEAVSSPEISYVIQRLSNSLLLLCCDSELSLYSMKSVVEGSNKSIRKVDLVQQCCWITTFKKNNCVCGLILLYQTGVIEIRSLPTLEVMGEISLQSILRWNFKTNMEKTVCSSTHGQIILVNGNETALISLLPYENELRIPESLPCLHDKVLAAVADTNGTAAGILGDIIKNIKGGKAQHSTNKAEVHMNYLAKLERLFSSPPFLKPFSTTAVQLDIDDIQIDEPLVVSSSQKSNTEKRAKGTDKEKLFEGATSNPTPRPKTAEEIKAKYRKPEDASAAAAQARDKLMERQQKLEKLSENTEELKSGAENFASMANELAKRMENRKWWHI